MNDQGASVSRSQEVNADLQNLQGAKEKRKTGAMVPMQAQISLVEPGKRGSEQPAL